MGRFIRQLPWLLLWASPPLLADASLHLRLMPTYSEYDTVSPLAAATQPATLSTMNEEFGLQWREGGFTLRTTLNATQASEGEGEAGGTLNELFYDTSAGPLDLSVGKKILSWGVGYAFRPLDRIQQERRLTLQPLTLEGVPQLSLEHFTATGAVGLTYANRLQWDGAAVDGGEEEWALRWYGLLGDWDLQLLAHHNEADGNSLGGGFSWVGGESLELHAAVLRQQHGGPMRVDDATRALLGMSWTWENGCSLLAEYWHDGTALTTEQWQQILSAPVALAGSEGSASLLRENLFLRMSYDGENYDPAVELLYTPEDEGGVLTLRLVRELRQQQQFTLGLRHSFGPADAAFANLPEELTLFAAWERAYGL